MHHRQLTSSSPHWQSLRRNSLLFSLCSAPATEPIRYPGHQAQPADGTSARFYGSAGSVKLAQPIVGMAATHTGAGYRIVAADGGIFNYGDAPLVGSAASRNSPSPFVGMAAV